MKKAKALLSFVLVLLLVFGTAMVSFAAEVTEKEPNNDRASATEFNINNVITGSISDASDVDWFKVTPTKFGLAHLTVTQKGSDDFRVSVYDNAENLITDFSAFNATTDSPSFAVSNQTYFIKIEPGSVISNSSYTLDLSSKTYNNGEIEPNDEIANSNIIKLDKDHNSGTLMGAVTSGDVDWYRFSSVSGYFYYELENVGSTSGTVTADVISILGTGDLGNTVVGSVTAGAGSGTVRSADIGTKEAAYFIKVTGNGVYSLNVYARLDNKNEYEYNDTTAYANPYTIDYTFGMIYGTISHNADVDYYRLTTTDKDKNSSIVVSAFNAENYKEYDKNASWTAALINSKGEVLEEKTVTTEAPAVLDLAKPGAGTYYIKITKGTVSTNALYVISSKEAKEPEKEYDSFLDRLRYGINWADFWERNPFKELMGNINIMGTLGSLFKLSFGTIGQWIMRLLASRA